MIARLRRRHRWTVILLAIAVPAIFIWAMVARRAVPAVGNAPGARSYNGEVRP